MSQESLMKAFELLESDELYDSLFFSGEKSLDIVEKAEKTLGLRFPKDYRDFVLGLGAGSVGSSEIYGVINDDFINSSVPDAVWSTLKAREAGLPKNLIKIGSHELGSPCIKVTDDMNQSVVIAYYVGFPEEAQTYEVLAESFGDYFLGKIREEIENLG
jgi:SMI1 / KNR4 family.